MKLVRSTAFIAIAVSSTALMLGGCSDTDKGSTSSSDSTSGSASTRPTLTASKLQPPSQHNQYTNKGRPEIAFDPCTWISDETIRKSRFDPATRQRGDDQIAEVSFLTCDFSSDSEDLMLNSGNATWDENLTKAKSYSEPVTINGREGLWVREPQLQQNCEIDLRTKSGFVQIVVVSTDIENTTRPCGNLQTIASNIEPEIGEGN